MYKEPLAGLFVRNKGQEGVVAQQKEYNRLKKIPSAIGAVVLDIGGHIGSFAWFALNSLSAKSVTSVEPDPENAEVYKKNWSKDKRVTLIEGALSDTQKEATLFLGKNYSSCNSLTHFRGREGIPVKCTTLKATIARIRPTLIKCDIEGGEYALNWDSIPKYVKTIIFEFHYQKKEWLEKQIEIDTLLKKQGFVAVKEPANKVTFTKVCIAIYSR